MILGNILLKPMHGNRYAAIVLTYHFGCLHNCSLPKKMLGASVYAKVLLLLDGL